MTQQQFIDTVLASYPGSVFIKSEDPDTQDHALQVTDSIHIQIGATCEYAELAEEKIKDGNSVFYFYDLHDSPRTWAAMYEALQRMCPVPEPEQPSKVSEPSAIYRHKLGLIKSTDTIFAEPIQVYNSDSAAAIGRKFWDNFSQDIEIRESVYLLLLDKGNKPIGFARISEGGTAGTVIDTRLRLSHIVLSNASGVILYHNHPSGKTRPSDADISITRRVRDACTLIDTTLLDHIIVTDQSHFSFADEGMI